MTRRLLAAFVAALAAALACAADAQAAAPAHPLLAAGEAAHYLYPLGAAQHQEDVIASMAMLSLLSRKSDADGQCESDACVHDRRDISSEMALAYSRLGMHLLALRLSRAVVQDAPGDGDAHYNYAVELESARQTETAAKEYETALALADGKDRKTEEGAARFYLLTDQLDLARTHFEHCILVDGDPDLAQYCAIGLILAKIHGGTDSLVPLEPSASWPGPLLAYQRRGDETALAAAVAQADDPMHRRQRLCEALYYAGERELQLGRRELALRFFRASVAQRVESFWETLAAMRRIEQLHGNDDLPPPPVPPPSHIPIG